MKTTFYINYHTQWGERLVVNIKSSLNHNETGSQSVDMTPVNGDIWECTTDIDDNADSIEYSYRLVGEGGQVLRREYGTHHRFTKNGVIASATAIDRWHDIPAEKPFYSSAFTECINRRDRSAKTFAALTGCISFNVDAPCLKADETLALCGNIEGLGNWDPTKAPVMNDNAFPLWQVQIPLHTIDHDLEFKFVIVRKKDRSVVEWEKGPNRRLIGLQPGVDRHIAVDCGSIADPMPQWHGAGTAIPVFSIRTEEDFGVGDFYSMMKMIDWCHETGQKFLQILPINDTTMTGFWTDSYPYNANSTFALHPMYLHVQAIGAPDDAHRRAHFANLAEELNRLPEVDYERVNRAKEIYTREIYAVKGVSTLAGDDYKEFYKRNSWWLDDYAAFRVLRDKFATPDHRRWGQYADYDRDSIRRFAEENHEEIGYHCFVQFHLDRQLRHVKEYAAEQGVAIKGDIPIGISHDSVDAWTNPRLFNLDCQAGAPPDAFSTLGQNWGFPTYNWEVMSRDGFEWWKSRFRKMSEYFDAYRIDHVLGFFRIWQIPMEAIHGLLGVFNPALPLSPEEMRTRYGFEIDPEMHCCPYMTESLLEVFFAGAADEVRDRYLTLNESTGRLHLKPEVDNQRKIAGLFAAMPKTAENTRICEGLMSMVDDVLFIEDPVEKGKYHPRISGQFTEIYHSLTEDQRRSFDALYEDFYYHRHNGFWHKKAMWKLPPLIDATDMLVCAEDLGMIPACVPDVIHQLQILSLEIQRMPKEFGVRFGDTSKYPYYSVCTTSTHDMGGIRQWWEEDRTLTQDFYNQVLHLHGTAPEIATPEICGSIVKMHLESPSMLCILPLQDWLSTDGTIRRDNPREEQINVPSNPKNYWHYRMHLTVESLLANNDFNLGLKTMIEESGR